MTARVALAIVAALVVILSGGPAFSNAGCQVRACAGTGSTYIWGNAHDEGRSSDPRGPGLTSPPTRPDGTWHVKDFCDAGPQFCRYSMRCPDGQPIREQFLQTPSGITNVTRGCPSSQVNDGPTTTDLEDAYRRLPMPASTLHIQPGGGRTRVNFDTIFYTTSRPFSRAITLLGHHVVFHITPATYTWNWGDGETDQTSWPGRPFDATIPVSDDITHRYERHGTYRPRLDTTYTATYTLDDGPSQPVLGTVTIRGTPTSLEADTYTPVLVD